MGSPSQSVGKSATSALPSPVVESKQSRRVGVFSLTCIGFFWVSGGIYGNEELISAAPPLIMAISVLIGALVFALPQALITAELGTALPDDGGMVSWVHTACGSLVGGQTAYWVWLTNLLDAAVYPQMAAQYVSQTLHLGYYGEQVVVFSFIVAIAFMNLLGLDCITKSQAVAFVVSLMPVLLFIFIGTPEIDFDLVLSSSGSPADWPLLISWTLWLYSGFQSLGSMAGEIDNPRRTYPAVISLLLPLATVLNLLPFAIAISLDPVPSHYTAGYFSILAGKLAGNWLKVCFVIGANISLIGLYHSQILTAERTLLAVVQKTDVHADGAEKMTEQVTATVDNSKQVSQGKICQVSFMNWLRHVPSGGGAPRGIVLLNAVFASLLTRVDYGSLVMVEMMVTCLSTTLFLYAFVSLRIRNPDLPRPFRLPGGNVAAVAYAIPPFLICLVTLALNFMSEFNAIAFACVLAVGLLGQLLCLLMFHVPVCRDSVTEAVKKIEAP